MAQNAETAGFHMPLEMLSEIAGGGSTLMLRTVRRAYVSTKSSSGDMPAIALTNPFV
jgi:hypothetical protein